MGQENKTTATLFTSWLIIWVIFGTFSLYSHNILLPYIFFFFAIAVYISHLYLACTRCFYFGKLCYIFGGIASHKIFKPRAQGPQDPDDSAVEALWLILGVFPVPFLLYYQDWLLLAVYAVLTYGWFYFRKRNICAKCENAWCPGKK